MSAGHGSLSEKNKQTKKNHPPLCIDLFWVVKKKKNVNLSSVFDAAPFKILSAPLQCRAAKRVNPRTLIPALCFLLDFFFPGHNTRTVNGDSKTSTDLINGS